MLALYLHIPFCKSRCIYCGFYSTTQFSWQSRYVDALCRELELRSQKQPKNGLKTVYFGGGTPSLLTREQFHQIFDAIGKTYIYNNVYPPSEVTIEANPDDVSDDFCEMLRELPVNRVSLGVQTFDDGRLRFLRRRHDSRQIGEAVRRLREAGFRNISIDLMFGFPDETLNDWISDIDQAIALDVEHVSAYSLMYEEDTALFKQWKSGKIEKIDDECSRQMYETLIDRLEAAGFEHYEISNFAKKGFRSRHNSSYWNQTPYVGIGAAAHSYDGQTRSWNVSNLREYVESIERGELPSEHEIIDETTCYNDLVTSAMRTREGIFLSSLEPKFRDYLLENAKKSLENNLLAIDHDHIHLTRNGLFVSDSVMSDLIYV